MKYTVTLKGRSFQVEISGGEARVDGATVRATLHALPGTPLRQLVLPDRSFTFAMLRRDRGWAVLHGGEVWDVEVVDERTQQLREVTGRGSHQAGHVLIRAPMPGLVLRVEVEPGKVVTAGDGVVVLEAMKMENELRTPAAGRVTAVHVRAGQTVEKGTALVEVASEG